MNRKSIKKDIAIIGMSCKFGKSDDLTSFWSNLVAGNELVHFYSDAEMKAIGINENLLTNPDFVNVKSTLNLPGSFDYPFFGYTQDEASVMDPQIRIMHQLVWNALEDAGYNIPKYKEKIGVYLSASDNQNWIAHTLINPNPKVNQFYASQLSNKNFISSLISYSLDLKGPSCYIHTACSSSLTAVHMACRNLLLRECNTAVAGGIRIDCSSEKGYLFEEGMIYSKDGHTRVFDKDSSGTIGGQGGAIVVLKRLEDALNDGDPVYAIIKSSAINNDGKSKVGYTAPSVSGQVDCITMAHRLANIVPEDISYIEAHGTATKLGDTIEIEALNKVFGYNTEHRCAIGSVKSNIGHPDTAAGIAGLVKLVLALKHKLIPPSINFNSANPEIDFKAGPFYVNESLSEWESKDEKPRMAGLSSLGIGGTNAHLVVEERPLNKGSELPDSFQLLLLSAKTQSSLEKQQQRLADHFTHNGEENLLNVSYTMMVGRHAFNFRSFTVGSQTNEVVKKLTNRPEIHELFKPPSLVFMFPGQGSQYKEMGKDIYLQQSFFRKIMDDGFAILKTKTGEDYKSVLGYSGSETDPDLVNKTLYTQPLIFLFEYALAKLLLHWGIIPAKMIGHSLGEYTAACLSEVMSFEDTLHIVVERAKLMDSIAEGSMVSVGASLSEIAPILNKELSIATVNAEGLIVISGKKSTVDTFIGRLDTEGIPNMLLKTSHAFHSAMMDPILEDFERAFNEITLNDPIYPYISNITGHEIEGIMAKDPKYWVKHLRETIQFSDGINHLMKNENAIFLEVGPGNVLSSLCKRSKSFEGRKSMSLVRHAKETKNDNETILTAVGELWCHGIEVQQEHFYENESPEKISVPGYCFDEYIYDTEVDPFEAMLSNGTLGDLFRRPLDQWFYVPSWKKSLIPAVNATSGLGDKYLIFKEEHELIPSLIQELNNTGSDVIIVEKSKTFQKIEKHLFQVNPNNKKDFKLLFESLNELGITITSFVYCWFSGESNPLSVSKDFISALNLCQELAKYKPESLKKITYLVPLDQPVLGPEKISATSTLSKLLFDVVSQENPSLFSCTIDYGSQFDKSILVEKILKELKYNYTVNAVAYRNNERWLQMYDAIELSTGQQQHYIGENETFLFTGPLGNIGEVIATYLFETYNAEIIVFDDEVTALQKLQNKDLLKENKNRLHFYKVAVDDIIQLKDARKRIEEKHGNISGILHGTGNIDHSAFKTVENLEQESASEYLQSKMDGIHNVYSIFKKDDLKFVWVKSSLSSVLGGLTYAIFAASNKYIDSFISKNRNEMKQWFCVNLDGFGHGGINANELIEIFEKSFSIETYPQLIVSIKDLKNWKNFGLATPAEEKPEKKERQLQSRPLSIDAYLAPNTDVEIEICALWEDFFGYKNIGIKDNFFELGGDSLKVMTMLKRVQKAYEIEVNLLDFYAEATIEALSNEIDTVTRLRKIQQGNQKKNSVKI